ncbi:MAG TPA: hypothetical protein VI653_23460 [Steroidobacteraceae bacterium]|jgi:hypothetical protein
MPSHHRKTLGIVLAIAVIGIFVGVATALSPTSALRGRSVVCRAPRVHTTIPAGARAIGFSGRTPPWVRTNRHAAIGFLFYYGEPPFWSKHQLASYLRHATIGTRGRLPYGNTKILWWIRARGGARLAIIGRRLDHRGRFRQTVNGDGTSFPSIVDVPAAGCWRLTLMSGGKLEGGLVFRAIDT